MLEHTKGNVVEGEDKVSKVFVVPDVHLKPWIFEKASDLIKLENSDHIVILGDLVDDWDQGMNVALYNETFDAAIRFCKEHNGRIDWIYGNHEMSYVWEKLESGYSPYAHETVISRLKELEGVVGKKQCNYIIRLNKVLFSHGGLTQSFIQEYFGDDRTVDIDQIVQSINRMGIGELWKDNSPIWARPQNCEMRLYHKNVFQVVGHTPVKKVLREDNLLTVDTFSTYRDGKPIGDEKFVWIDTETLKYSIV